MKLDIKTDYWEKADWQNKVNNLLWIIWLLSVWIIALNPRIATMIVILTMNGLTTIPMKISYEKWEKKRLHKKYGVKTKDE